MKLIDNIKKELKDIWSKESNRKLIKDVLLFGGATIVFHFLYWHTNMNSWIFGPFTKQIYAFFTMISFKGSLPLCQAFIDKPFDVVDTSYYFYTINHLGIKIYNSSMAIVADCSGIKQLLQYLLIIVLCSGKWWGKTLWYVMGCVVIELFNILRIFLLTWLYADHPDMFQSIHDWIARPLMYVVIFSLWAIWITYFAHKKDKQKHPQSAHQVED
jgi:exosortase/archaeosortase family protein